MDILSFITIILYVIPSLQFSTALDSISHSQNLTDGKILVSESGTFALGIFSPGNSKKSYLGIWQNNISTQTVVWVANRQNPINDSSGVLMLNSTSNLVLSQNGKIVWYTNSTKQAKNCKAYLLDSGNLVIRDEEESNPEAYLWQSFDYPTDTLLEDMKLGWDLKNNLNGNQTAWKSPDDPSPGDFSWAFDCIAPSQFITDGKTLISKAGTFEFGFFSPGNSNKRYLGVCYKKIPIQTVVWVANRLNPINDSSGILTLNSTGHLVLTQNGTVVWCTSLLKQAQNPVAQLLDSGNLVVRDKNEPNPTIYLWQGFDYPTDTLLPGMKLGWDFRIGLERRLTAWRSPDDPSPSDFYYGLVMHNDPDTYIMKGEVKYFRMGPWNGLHPSGLPEIKPNPVYLFWVYYSMHELYYMEALKNNSVLTRLALNHTSYTSYTLQRYVWAENDKNWRIFANWPQDYCDTYALCGANGVCITTKSPACQCLRGFSPNSPEEWNAMDSSKGCVRSKPLSCKDNKKVNKDGFIKVAGLKVPGTTYTWLDMAMNLEECREKCLNKCSCMAYTNFNISGAGTGCVLWFGDPIDMKQFPNGGQDLYIRMDASEIAQTLVQEPEHRHRKKLTLKVTAITIAVILGILLLGCYYICKVCGDMNVAKNAELNQNIEGDEEDLDFPLLDLFAITTATNNFSVKNKLGQGGFGPVYGGRLIDGQEIAVKRLSKRSGQGVTEFKNEVKLIARLQHRNLVRLLGCCIQGQEKILVYEYMPNNSLDSFIFANHVKGKLLDWSKRFYIICGIARGLLYLHQDSRLRIIHRDIKAINVLLDDKINAKISDFSMAIKTIGGDQTEYNTNRVVGIYGYMAPKYTANGLFSMKSDIFSYSVLMLEIVCGKRNRGSYHPGEPTNLITNAWSSWQHGRVLELVDKNIEGSCVVSEVMRCIHVSLLCVQQDPKDRPDMPSVILMLASDTELPDPKQPGFLLAKYSVEPTNSSASQPQSGSRNEATFSALEGR